MISPEAQEALEKIRKDLRICLSLDKGWASDTLRVEVSLYLGDDLIACDFDSVSLS